MIYDMYGVVGRYWACLLILVGRYRSLAETIF
jgi:hypothetical protein